MRHVFDRISALTVGVMLAFYVSSAYDTNVSCCAEETSVPNWIWKNDQRVVGLDVVFNKSIDIAKTVSSATLRCVGQSTSLDVSMDGDQLAELEPYDPIRWLDVTENLTQGDHQIEAKCHSVLGTPAFFVMLDVTYQDGTTQRIVSDESWLVGKNNAYIRSAVESGLAVPLDRRVQTGAVENYEQWKLAHDNKSAESAKFKLVDGFQIQRLRSAKQDEGSWVSMVFDPQGRLIIAREKSGLLRMTLDGDDVRDAELIEDTLKECRGLLFVGNDLYANANNSKGLYRLKSDGNDRFTEPELVFASSGGVGHGRNDLALGPDGMIYSIHGDAVDLPGNAIRHTSPGRHAKSDKTPKEGHLLRINPEDGRVEVLAAGLRNPFGIDFNADGEIFTYDADAEYDMGAPWYRPTRVSHIVTGADYGWRGVTKSWPPYYPDRIDFARPGLDIGKGSPTAVKFGTRSNFPYPYRDALFILDWTYGRIVVVHMIPRGASYLMNGETFLQGSPLNVTDLDFGPDGSMYFVTGGRKTKSALYRVKYTGLTVDRPKLTKHQAVRETFAKRNRFLRKELESMRVPNDKRSLAELLGDSDPWIRYAARQYVQHHPEEKPTMDEFSISSMLAAWPPPKLRYEIQHDHAIFSLLWGARMSPETAAKSQKLGYLHVVRKWLDSDLANKRLKTDVLSKLQSWYPDNDFDVNRVLGELLVRLKSPQVVPKTIQLLRQATDQKHRMQYLYVLRTVDFGWTNELRREYFTALNATGDFIGGDGMPTFLAKIREEAVVSLTDTERSDLGALLEEPRTETVDIVERPQRKFVREWTVKDLLASEVRSDAPKPNAERGAKIFSQALCANCHRFAGRGHFVGPDLTLVSRRFGREDILASIIDPSRVVAEKYQSLKVITTDGKTHVGQVVLGGDYRSPKLRLATDPSDATKTIEIEKSEIEAQKKSSVSWMPKGLLDTFSREEIEDLIMYLSNS